MRIKCFMHSDDAVDAADVVGEEGGLAVAEPLLEPLVAAEGVVPDGLGHVFPAGGGVEVDVEVAHAACAIRDLAGAGHGDAALPTSSIVGLGLPPVQGCLYLPSPGFVNFKILLAEE